MTGWIIAGGILLLLFLIAMIRGEAVLEYNGEFGLTVRVAGIPVRILPKKPKR